MDLKNITMDDLKQKLASVEKKTLIKFGSGFGAIVLFLIIYYIILNPMVKERKAKYNDKILKQNEIAQFENEIITFKARIKKMKPDFEKTSTLFFLELMRLSLSSSLIVFDSQPYDFRSAIVFNLDRSILVSFNFISIVIFKYHWSEVL